MVAGWGTGGGSVGHREPQGLLFNGLQTLAFNAAAWADLIFERRCSSGMKLATSGLGLGWDMHC